MTTDAQPAGEVAVDVAGNLTLGGETIAVPYAAATIERAVSMVHGRVLELGLGLGQTRDALLAADHVAEVTTVEQSVAVADLYVEGGGDADTVVEEGATSALALPGEYDSALVDLDPAPTVGEPEFQAALKAKLSALGARVVVITEDRTARLSGFELGLEERTEDGRWLLVFDRFEPEAGIGVRNPHGENYVPGYGWSSPGLEVI